MRVVIRPPLWKRLIVSLLAALLVGALVEFGSTLGGWRFAAWAAAALVVLAAVRYWFLRVKAGTDELVIVNWLRRHHVAWPDVTRCSYNFGLHVTVRDGRVLGSAAIPFARSGFESHGRWAAAEIEAVRRRRQADARRRKKDEQRRKPSSA